LSNLKQRQIWRGFGDVTTRLPTKLSTVAVDRRAMFERWAHVVGPNYID